MSAQPHSNGSVALAQLAGVMDGLRDLDLANAAHVQALEILLMAMLFAHPNREAVLMRFEHIMPTVINAAREVPDRASGVFTDALEAHMQRIVLQTKDNQVPSSGAN